MKTKYFYLAALASLTLASCSSDDFVGDLSPTTSQVTNETDAINFGFDLTKVTRGDIAGGAAADLLSNRFYVTGTKGTEKEDSPTDSLVFDNYLVMYKANTAGTTESNTANWEYVGLAPEITATITTATGTGVCKDSLKLSDAKVTTQTIKYWDYTHLQYDFLAFSTGKFKAVAKTNLTSSGDGQIADDEIGVTAMKYGQGLKTPPAYTFYIPTVQALKNAYITDITEVARADFGKEVTLKFKNLGSKVRVALYETVPGYSILASSVKFYSADGTPIDKDATGYVTPTTDATLISANTSSFASKGSLAVYFPNIGTNNHGNDNYDKAATTVTPVAGATSKTFGTLENKADKEGTEATGALYLGRTLPTATFAGLKAADYYETVFPVSTGYPLTLRVDYQLVATDGSGETINVYGAKAVVPGTYTKWQPNYAYTYIFKITDNTNGWTSPDAVQDGLFPITFDAVVAEFTDPSGEQTTVTTVATPSITTYQQGHTYATNEYNHTGEKLYVQVMDNNLSPAELVGKVDKSTLPLLNAAQESATPKYHASILYKVTGVENPTEAMVMDALENRDATIGDYNTDVKGRNGITLTYNANIDNAVTSIVNGVDDNAITVAAGEAAEIAIGSLDAGTYAYVYDYSWKSTSPATWTTSTSYTNKSEVVIYEPVIPTTTIGSKAKYYSINTTALDGVIPSTAAVTVDNDHLYFSKTTNGSSTTTYSYISVVNKVGTTLPKGVVVVAKSDTSKITEVNGSDAPAEKTFYFDKYFSNNGSYAVKVIKVI